MSTNESAQSVESNQKTDIEIDREAFEDFAKQRTIDLEETNGGLHRPVFTTVEQAVDSLTHVLAKLLQTVMLMEKHLADISKAIDRVAR